MNIKVKALEWVGASTMWASTPFGSYCIDRLIGKSGYVWCAPAGGLISADAIDEAQAAAQADYERLIISAIEPSPDMREVVEALERLSENIASFDAEVAFELSNEGERADLWTDIDVNVEDLRIVVAALRSLTGAKP
jgi:hypothetical protein